MKRSLSIILAFMVAVAVVLAGCSSGGGDTAAGGDKAQGGNDQGQKKYVFKVGYVNAEQSPVDQAVVKLNEILKEKTNGQIEFQRFPNSQLGGERDMLEGMKIGTVDAVITGDAAIPMFAPKFAGLSTPYAIKSIDHELKVLNGDIGKEMAEEFNKALNSTVVDYWVRGARNLTANREIKTPDDLKGMKLRVPEVPLSVESWKALGANPTPMAFPDLFVGLQQGVVDGQENPLDLIYTSKFYEVQKYTMLTEHLFAPFIFLINDKKLASLPDDLRQTLLDAIKEAGKYEVELTKQSDEDYKNKLKQAGMNVVEVDKEVWAKKLDELKPYKNMEKDWIPNLLQRIKEAE